MSSHSQYGPEIPIICTAQLFVRTFYFIFEMVDSRRGYCLYKVFRLPQNINAE